MSLNVSPNNDVWAWERSPDQEGEILERASSFTFVAEDTIKKYDLVALYGSGSTVYFPTQLPTVAACGSDYIAGNVGTVQFKCIGMAMHDAASGTNVTVKMEGMVTLKTNAVITVGAWLRPSHAAADEKKGCAYASANTGENIIGIALNNTVAIAEGTGTSASPYHFYPVAVKLFIHGDPLNR